MVLITALISIAERVGANRIFKAGGRFHHPLGDLTMTPEAELLWRTGQLRAASRMLTQRVDGPTVRDITQLVAWSPQARCTLPLPHWTKPGESK